MMRNTKTVQGPTPFISARASSQDCPSCTFHRISSDRRTISAQQRARLSGRLSARTVNGVKANGGSMAAPGPTIVGGRLFVGTVYMFGGGSTPGNVLLVFSAQ
jgi:hypothetical protein